MRPPTVTENEHYVEVISEDDQGRFTFRTHFLKQNRSQISINAADGESTAYINVELDEITAIRDALNLVIKSLFKQIGDQLEC